MTKSKDNEEEKDVKNPEDVNLDETEMSEEEVEALLEKFDAEARTRKLTGIAAGVVFVVLLSFSLFQLYTGAFGQFTAYIQRTVHLGFAFADFLIIPC